MQGLQNKKRLDKCPADEIGAFSRWTTLIKTNQPCMNLGRPKHLAIPPHEVINRHCHRHNSLGNVCRVLCHCASTHHKLRQCQCGDCSLQWSSRVDKPLYLIVGSQSSIFSLRT